MSSLDIKLTLFGEKPSNNLPSNIAAIRINDKIVFVRKTLFGWQQLSASEQSELKTKLGLQ